MGLRMTFGLVTSLIRAFTSTREAGFVSEETLEAWNNRLESCWRLALKLEPSSKDRKMHREEECGADATTHQPDSTTITSKKRRWRIRWGWWIRKIYVWLWGWCPQNNAAIAATVGYWCHTYLTYWISLLSMIWNYIMCDGIYYIRVIPFPSFGFWLLLSQKYYLVTFYPFLMAIFGQLEH